MLRRTFAALVGVFTFGILAATLKALSGFSPWTPSSVAIGTCGVAGYVALAVGAGYVSGLIAPARKRLDWTQLPLTLAVVGMGAVLLGLTEVVLADDPAAVNWPWWPTATLLAILPAHSYGWHLKPRRQPAQRTSGGWQPAIDSRA